MALARLKVWGQEILTFEDLNAEFDNILNNAANLISPLTGTLDLDGNRLILDAANSTWLSSPINRAIDFTSVGSKTGTPSNLGSILAVGNGAHVFTDNATAASGTATVYTTHSFSRATLIASNTLVTTTNAATVYIEDAPGAGTNETITNSWALWVDAGRCKFDDSIVLANAKLLQSVNNAGTTTVNIATVNGSDEVVIGQAAARVRLDSASTSRVHIPVVATASLPTGASAEDGSILIEDNGAGDRNVIIYAGGQRFRIDGGAAV